MNILDVMFQAVVDSPAAAPAPPRGTAAEQQIIYVLPEGHGSSVGTLPGPLSPAQAAAFEANRKSARWTQPEQDALERLVTRQLRDDKTNRIHRRWPALMRQARSRNEPEALTIARRTDKAVFKKATRLTLTPRRYAVGLLVLDAVRGEGMGAAKN